MLNVFRWAYKDRFHGKNVLTAFKYNEYKAGYLKGDNKTFETKDEKNIRESMEWAKEAEAKDKLGVDNDTKRLF